MRSLETKVKTKTAEKCTFEPLIYLRIFSSPFYTGVQQINSCLKLCSLKFCVHFYLLRTKIMSVLPNTTSVACKLYNQITKYLLIPWIKAFLRKMYQHQSLARSGISPHFAEPKRCTAVPTRACPLSLSLARRTQSRPHICLKSFLISFFLLRLGVPRSILSSNFLPKPFRYSFLPGKWHEFCRQ